MSDSSITPTNRSESGFAPPAEDGPQALERRIHAGKGKRRISGTV